MSEYVLTMADMQVYTRCLDRWGPRVSLRRTTIFFSAILGICGLLVLLWRNNTSQTVLFILFILQNVLVQLLYSQHWSFLTSIVQTDWMFWLAPLAGIGSLASTFAGLLVAPLLEYDSCELPHLLIVASFCMLVSAVCGDMAYRRAEQVTWFAN